MMNQLVAWFSGSAWMNAYWEAPAGLFTLAVIFICSVGNIMLEWVEDNLLDRIFFTIYALCCLATFIHIYEHTEPYNVVKTLLFTLALQFLIKFIYRVRKRFATGQTVIIHPGEHL